MRDDQIRIKPFEFLEVLHFSMIKKENEHSVVSFSARIREELEENYMKLAIDDIDAEVLVLQSMETEDMQEIMEEAKKNNFSKAAGLLQESARTMPVLQNLNIKGIDDVVDGVNLMVQTQKTMIPQTMLIQHNNSYMETAESSAKATDILQSLPIHQLLKAKGVQKAFDTLNAMKAAGIFKSLKTNNVADVAKSDAAARTVYKETVLLKGVVTELGVQVINGVKSLYGTVKSGTYLMDVIPHIRTWQEKSITYDNMINTIIANYQNASYIRTLEDNEIDTFVLQYKETDWEFAKRMASHQNKYLIADDLTGGIKFYYGMPEPRSEIPEINTNTYMLQKRLTEYLTKKDNDVPNIMEKDAIYYQICLRDVYYIGDKIKLNGQELYITSIESKLQGAELYHNYTLKTENGFNLPRIYNRKNIGVSLTGVIVEVAKDVVKITVHDDENLEGCKTRWFPYSTVYSSPDGTGWYCMPEPGDAIRLYLPSDDEREAYVISAVHLVKKENNDWGMRMNPDHKSIMNKYGKEVLFTPTSITITNNKGMAIKIIDGVGVEIFSDKKVEIGSLGAIEIISKESEIKVVAPKSITLIQSGTTITMKDNIVLNGAQTNIQ